MTSDLMPIPVAAQKMGVPVGTVRRWIRQGCPVAVQGRRGRGHAAMLCMRQVRAWRHAQAADDRLAVELAGVLPEIMGQAAYSAWLQTEGGDRRRLAGVLAAGWFTLASSALDALRERCPGAHVPEITGLPEPIDRLRKIATSD